MRIRMTRNTQASGISLSEGQDLEVPGQISEADARKLVLINKAVIVPPSFPEKPMAQEEPKPENQEEGESESDKGSSGDETKPENQEE